MADLTAPVALMNDKERQWLEGAIKDKLLRLIDFDDIVELQMGVASGGFGIVHAGRWRHMRVAVKVLYNPADFIQEVGIHKLVQDSENIVKFYGITKMKASGDYGMVLQYASRGSLRDYLSRYFHTLDWGNKMRLAHDVASGISFIHEDNICHHDLHSRNVLIDQSGRALITDFGLSRDVNNAHSNNGVRGVVPYISPERLKNAEFDHSSDVYSLGVIMWELTSGCPPFVRDGDNFLLPFEIMRGKREEIVPGTPVEYSALYQKCWDGEPLNRPQLPEILSRLNRMLQERNGEIAEENGNIQPTQLDDLYSTHTQTHPSTNSSERHGPQPKSAPLVRNTSPVETSWSSSVGNPSQKVNIAPLVPRHQHSRIQPHIPHFEPDATEAALSDQIAAIKLGEDGVENGQSHASMSPVTPVRGPWLPNNVVPPLVLPRRQTGVSSTVPTPGGHVRPASPMTPVSPARPTPRTLISSRENSASFNGYSPVHGPGNMSPTMPSMRPMDNKPLEEIGSPSPSGISPNLVGPNQVARSRMYPPMQEPVSLPSQMNAVVNTSGPLRSPGNSQNVHWMPSSGRTNIRDFFMACYKGNLEAVQWHLNQGARVMQPYENMSGRTPLHAAAMSDSYEVVKLLCESAGRSLNLNEQDDSSQTPLHLLTHYGRNCHKSLLYLLQKGANPNAVDNERRTPLMTVFILTDNAQLVETLLDYGADPNIRCQENNALAEAAIRVRFQCVKVLLETDLSMSEQSSLEHAMDVCYRVIVSENRNKVLNLLVRWKNPEGIPKRQMLAKMILAGSSQLGERRVDYSRMARLVLASAGVH